MNYSYTALRSCLHFITVLQFNINLSACNQHYRAYLYGIILLWTSLKFFI